MSPRNCERSLNLETGRRSAWKAISFADPAGLTLVNANVAISPDGQSYAFDYARSFTDLYLVEGLK